MYESIIIYKFTRRFACACTIHIICTFIYVCSYIICIIATIFEVDKKSSGLRSEVN